MQVTGSFIFWSPLSAVSPRPSFSVVIKTALYVDKQLGGYCGVRNNKAELLQSVLENACNSQSELQIMSRENTLW